MSRDEELWKQSLLSLSEENLFNLLRNYLGEIKTPYNKQNLITRLSDFINKPDTKNKIISLISKEDATLLSLIFYKKGAGSYELQQALGFENGFLFRLRLSNLEERLLIYNSNTGTKEPEFFINPLLCEELERRVISPFTFLKIHETGNPPEPARINDKIFNPFFSFLIHNNIRISDNGIPGIREMQLFEKTFSFLFPEKPEKLEKIFPLILEGTIHLGLFNINNKGICVPDLNRIIEFAGLTGRERLEIFTSATLVSSPSNEEIRKGVNLLRTLREAIPSGSSVEEESLEKSAPLFFAESGLFTYVAFDRILERLLLLDFFRKEGDNLFITEQETENQLSAPIIISSNFEATFPFDTPFIPQLAFLFSIETFDIYSQYILNKEAFYKAFLSGIDAKQAKGLLSEERCQEIPQNIICAIEEWETEFKSLTLYEGITIIADEAKRELMESIESLTPFILEKPAPGIYIFSKWSEEQWLSILADYDLLPIRKGDTSHRDNDPTKNRSLSEIFNEEQDPIISSTEFNKPLSAPLEEESSLKSSSNRPEQSLSEKFLAPLEKLQKEGIEQEKIDVIKERIERKIIFDEKRVDPNLIPQEIHSVHFTDVNGKLRLIDSALSHQFDILILHCPSADDPLSMEEITVYPEKIEKRETGKYLIGQTFPAGAPFERKVNQIGKIIRKRLSLLS